VILRTALTLKQRSFLLVLLLDERRPINEKVIKSKGSNESEKRKQHHRRRRPFRYNYTFDNQFFIPNNIERIF